MILNIVYLMFILSACATFSTAQKCSTTSELCTSRHYIVSYTYRQHVCPYIITCTNITAGDAISYPTYQKPSKLMIINSDLPTLKGTLFERVAVKNITILNSNVKKIEPGVFYGVRMSIQIIQIVLNNITEIPNNLFNGFSKLQYLNLSRNSIEYFGSENCEGSPIQWFDFSFNEFKTVPAVVSSSTTLTELYLNNNKITKLTNSSFNTQLKELHLQHNEIEFIENGALESLKSLTVLDLGDNRLYKMKGGILPSNCFQPLRALLDFSIYQNSLSGVDTNIYPVLTKVDTLNLNDNYFNITILNNIALNNIQHLYIANNNLSSIPIDAFQHLTRLRTLHLSSNFIQVLIPGTFSKLYQLENLYLQGNKLKHLPDGLFQHNNMLEDLYIDDNLFEDFNQNALSHESPPSIISLDNNTWSCDTLSNIIRKLNLLKSKVLEGTHRSTPNINGNSCSLNSTNKNGNVTIETLLKENLEMLKTLNEVMIETELGNEQIVDLLKRLFAATNETSKNYTLEEYQNSTGNTEDMVLILSEIRDGLIGGNQVNTRLLDSNPPSAYVYHQNNGNSTVSSTLLATLLCVQIIIVLLILSGFIYYVKFRRGSNRSSEATLLQSFDE